MTEHDFLRTILETPSDGDSLRVYADWLEENGEEKSPKIEYLRLSAEIGKLSLKDKQRERGRRRLQKLAAKLDTKWLAVVSRLTIEFCASKIEEDAYNPGQIPGLEWNYVCDRTWDALTPTVDSRLRFCESCQHNVHYCDSIDEARSHARQGHCVAVDLRIHRKDGDIAPFEDYLLGMIDLGAEEEEFERQKTEMD